MTISTTHLSSFVITEDIDYTVETQDYAGIGRQRKKPYYEPPMNNSIGFWMIMILLLAYIAGLILILFFNK